VVQVAPTGTHVAKWAAARADRVGHEPAARKARGEADGVQERALAAMI
jgi:hypothetical protein